VRHARVTVEHAKEPEIDYHEWVCLRRPQDYDFRDGEGRQIAGGVYRWVRFRCNNPDCNAEAWVSLDALDKIAAALIEPIG
jgi:hypothetical protein